MFKLFISAAELDLNSDYPTDRGKFPEIILSSNLKRQITMYGPCRPTNSSIFKNNINTSGRHFSTDYYLMTTKTGNKIPRTWLCYSVILNQAYCETCWLFSDRSYKSFIRNGLME